MKPGDLVPDISAEVRERLDALRAGQPTAGSAVPADIRDAINAGHVGQVGIYCDGCLTEVEADVTGATSEERFAGLRKHLAEQLGWHITPDYDGCPNCPPCERCKQSRAAAEPCCSGHGKKLCHLCYRRTHFVEVCVAGCGECVTEGLPVNLADLRAAFEEGQP